MKRTVKRPDGTEEVLEGTAEELAEYERKLQEKEQPPRKKKPEVLRGSEKADEGKPQEDLLDFIKRLPTYPDPTNPVYPGPIWIGTSCSQCGSLPCRCWPSPYWITLDHPVS